MDIGKRIILIQLLSEELVSTASQYEQEVKVNKYPCCGYGGITADNCKTTLKRRITTLRQELLELEKTL